MSYLDQSRRASPGSMAAVVAIHAGIGAVLVFGLSVAGTVIEKAPPIPSFDVKDPPPPEPTPPDIEPRPTPDAASPPMTAPTPRRTVTTAATPPLRETFAAGQRKFRST